MFVMRVTDGSALHLRGKTIKVIYSDWSSQRNFRKSKEDKTKEIQAEVIQAARKVAKAGFLKAWI